MPNLVKNMNCARSQPHVQVATHHARRSGYTTCLGARFQKHAPARSAAPSPMMTTTTGIPSQARARAASANTHSNSNTAPHFAQRHRRRRAATRTQAAAEGEDTDTSNSDSGSTTSRVIVVTSGKGGVGKTTSSANLGMCMARLGYRVCLLDADIGLRNLDLLLGLENRVMYTAMEVLEGTCRLDQALIRDKKYRNLCMLSVSKNRQRYNVTRQNMELLVESIQDRGYDFIIIDCPAGIDVGFINAIAPAQEAVVVTTPEITAIRDADRVAGLLEANSIYNVKLLVNRVRPDMIKRNDMMSVRDVQEMLGVPLLGAIPEDPEVIVSTNRGEPLVARQKLSLSGVAYENAARRLVGQQDYLVDLSDPYKSPIRRIKDFFSGGD